MYKLFIVSLLLFSLSAEGQIKEYRSQSARVTVMLLNERQEVRFKTFDANLILNMQNGDFALRINPKNLDYIDLKDTTFSHQLKVLQTLGELDFAGNILDFDHLEYTNPENFTLQLNGELKINNQVFNKTYSLQYYYGSGAIQELYGTVESRLNPSFLDRLNTGTLSVNTVKIKVSFKLETY